MSQKSLDRKRLAALIEREERSFIERHPRSRELFERGRRALLAGVPMPWMTEWASPFPVFAAEAAGARFTDVDGNEYLDLCLGDTGAMTGHSPPPTAAAVAERAARGITLMLPTDDASRVAEELARRFGLPRWQFALTATDANRFALRLARAITARPRILVYAWCYHGTVDESFAIEVEGETRSRPDNIGPPVDPSVTTRAIEWNDVDALARALAPGDVACVLAEPAMTNGGIVLPDPAYHEALRELTREHGTLLVIDETHTFCAGPGGYTAAEGLEPDILTIGKAIAAGIPAAAYGMTESVAERVTAHHRMLETSDVGGIGGTLAGNALSLAAIRSTLEEVLTDAAFDRMIRVAGRYETGVNEVIAARGVPWHATRLGCRVEYHFRPTPPRNGSEAIAADDAMLGRYMHLHALNRGILLTPFHNMALMCPETTDADIDLHTAAFDEAVGTLVG
ncbi:MAG TPA: aspartate aminotransferase family protein [Solirubrobacterales bacterium]|nr:aspartate aminotransferase family protein [Solirubrobacterales bacterium]